MTNAAERAEVRFLEKQAQQHAASNAEVLKGIMATPFGRRWMHDLLSRCHIGASPFNEQANLMYFHAGEQNIGLEIWATLQTICPDLYIKMMQEENERILSSDIAIRSLRNTTANEPDSDRATKPNDDDIRHPGPGDD